MKSRKKKMFSPIHISTDEQISIHFGKASIQDERTCILKLELVEITLLTRRADSFAPGYTLFGVGGMAQGGE
jgi:hypothetical protein